MQRLCWDQQWYSELELEADVVLHADSFMTDDVRTKKGLDGLGAMGDIGWYCIGNILMAFGWEPPQLVQAAAGVCWLACSVHLHVWLACLES